MNEHNSQSSHKELLNHLIARYLEDEQVRSSSSRELIIQWHPELADDLRAFFASQDGMKADKAPSVDIDAPTIPPSQSATEDPTIPPSKPLSDAATIPPANQAASEDPTLPLLDGPSKSKNRSGEKVRYFGNYELLEEIARGGMGVVYKARQTKLNRLVALKMILAGQLAGEEDVKRFHTEAEAAANLDHPGIVPIYEIGEHDGQHYFSMAFVEGSSLAGKVAEGPLPAKEAALLTKKVAEAIYYAHQHDVIHRDLKPGNILLDEQGEPKVTDFGLAKKLESDVNLTSTGQILGTPSYMPPEQAAGKTEEIGPLADVYSLGAILYCLLTGRPPFQASNPMDTLLQVLEREPVPLRQLDRSVPRDLETISLKCLAKETHRRYGSPMELADDLGRWLDGKPIVARPVTRIEKAWLWCKRRPAIAGLGAAVAITILVAASVLYAQRLANQRSRAENERSRAESLVEAVLTAPPHAIPYAIESLRPLQGTAVPILQNRFVEENLPASQCLHVAYALAEFGQVNHEFIVTSIKQASPAECSNIATALSQDRDKSLEILRKAAAEMESDWRHKARLAIVTLHLGDRSIAKEMCQLRPDPIQRTLFIEEVSSWHGELAALAQQVTDAADGPLRSAIALAVGSVSLAGVTPSEKQEWQKLLADWYLNKPDTGTHSATGWALRKWKLKRPRITVSKLPAEGYNWYVNSVGMNMLRIPDGSFTREETAKNPKELKKSFQTPFRQAKPARRVGARSNFEMTSKKQITGKQQVTISQSFLLSDGEVTRRQFRRFINDPDYPANEKPKEWKMRYEVYSPTRDHPVVEVNWYDAILFCNWLSYRENLKPCYVRSGEKEMIETGSRTEEHDTWRLIPDADGYRLPTEAEWEYACRASTLTAFSFGNDETLLDHYAVQPASRTEIPGSKLPNGWGLFDMHGNVWEWCYDWYSRLSAELSVVDPTGPAQGRYRVLRGGSFQALSQALSSGFRVNVHRPTLRSHSNGFRVARTYP